MNITYLSSLERWEESVLSPAVVAVSFAFCSSSPSLSLSLDSQEEEEVFSLGELTL